MFLRFEDLGAEGIPFCKVHLLRLVRKGDFPAPVKIGANTNAWVKDEIQAWMRSKIDAPRRSKGRPARNAP